jgi:hypothetical protein
MKLFFALAGFVVSLGMLLPSLGAHDEKREAEKTEKKEPERRGDKKEKLEYGSKFSTKILAIKGDSGRDLTIETMVIDEKKVQERNNWATQRQQQLAQRYSQIMNVRDLKSRAQQLQTWNVDSANFQAEFAKKNIYSPKRTEVKATENARVRAMSLPVEFDDQGNQKKWSKKEIEERKDKTGLPGFPSDFDALRVGQNVDIYLTKDSSTAKGKKKDDDDAPAPKTPEFVMIVITGEGK